MIPPMRQQAEPVQEWLQIHRELMQLETAFTDLAMRAVHGEVAADRLQQERLHLLAMRELCTAAYERAFPKAANR